MAQKIFFGLLTVCLIMVAAPNTEACDFYFKVQNPKDTYKPGDELIVTVTLQLTHRNCEVDLDETAFSSEGIEIVGATNWVEINPKLAARKLKIKISDGNGTARLTAIRDCKKDGGEGSINFRKV